MADYIMQDNRPTICRLSPPQADAWPTGVEFLVGDGDVDGGDSEAAAVFHRMKPNPLASANRGCRL